MKREIKFRLWTGTMMEYWNHVKFFESLGFYLNYGDAYVPMQYTELKDIDNEDAYEGDIIKTDIGIGKIIFHCGCFMIEWIDDPESNMELLGISNFKRGTPREFEIIGNIYSKPESKQL